jgi:hypothetical protein
MKTQLDLQPLVRELKRRIDAAEDYISDTRRLGFSVEAIDGEKDVIHVPTLTLDNPDGGDLIEAPINDHAQQQIGQRLGVPSKFWDRMRDSHPDILTDVVTKLFTREPEVRMVRTLDGTARAFLSNRYRRLDYYDLMERSVLPALHEYGSEQAQVLSCGLTDTRLYVKVLFPDVQFEITPGDPMFGGVAIGNSEVGAGSLFVEPFTYRSFCTNGMIFGKQAYADFGLRKMHVGRQIEDTEAARALFSDATLRKEDEAFFSMAYDMIKGAATGMQFAAIADACRKAAGVEVGGDPVQVVERLAKATSVTEDERGSIMQHLIEGGDLTAWGYVNAITRTAEDVDSYDRATELERLGGDLVDWSASAWKALAVA